MHCARLQIVVISDARRICIIGSVQQAKHTALGKDILIRSGAVHLKMPLVVYNRQTLGMHAVVMNSCQYLYFADPFLAGFPSRCPYISRAVNDDS